MTEARAETTTWMTRGRRLGLMVLLGVIVVTVTFLQIHGLPAALAQQAGGAKTTARATLLVRPPSQLDAREREAFRATQVVLLKSERVMEAALVKEGIAGLPMLREQEDPIEWLSKELEVSFVQNSDALQVALTGVRPADQAKLVNAVVDAYLELDDHGVRAERDRRAQVLADIREEYRARLAREREQLRSLTEELGQASLPSDKVRDELLGEIERKRLHLELERATAEIKLERRKASAEPDRKKEVDDLQETLAILARQERVLNDAGKRLAETGRARQTAEHRLQETRDEIARANEAATKVAAELEVLKVERDAPARVSVIMRAREPRQSK